MALKWPFFVLSGTINSKYTSEKSPLAHPMRYRKWWYQKWASCQETKKRVIWYIFLKLVQMSLSDVNHHINAFFWDPKFFATHQFLYWIALGVGIPFYIWFIMSGRALLGSFDCLSWDFKQNTDWKIYFFRNFSLPMSVFAKIFEKSWFFWVKYSQIDIQINTCKHICK